MEATIRVDRRRNEHVRPELEEVIGLPRVMEEVVKRGESSKCIVIRATAPGSVDGAQVFLGSGPLKAPLNMVSCLGEGKGETLFDCESKYRATGKGTGAITVPVGVNLILR